MPEPSNSYQLTHLAENDLDESWAYTARTWSRDQADKYFLQIVNAFDAILAAPDKGVDVGDLRTGYFRWSVGKHYIFYRKAPYGQEIVRILHHQRDFPRHL